MLICLDETGFSNQNHKGRSYAPKGKTPSKEISTQRLRVNALVTISSQGTTNYKLYSERFTQTLFINFLRQIKRHKKIPILLCLDRHPVHTGKKVKNFCQNQGIELLFFPPYSPELNPVEYWNNDKKNKVNRNSFYSIDSMKNTIKNAIKTESKSKRSMYFKVKEIKEVWES